MNRRNFLQTAAMAVAGLVYDPELMLWRPPKAQIAVPSAFLPPGWCRVVIDEIAVNHHTRSLVVSAHELGVPGNYVRMSMSQLHPEAKLIPDVGETMELHDVPMVWRQPPSPGHDYDLFIDRANCQHLYRGIGSEHHLQPRGQLKSTHNRRRGQMTRDELLQSIKEEVEQVIDENRELEGDDFDTVENVVEKVCSDATDATDEANDEDDDKD